ncbi:V-type ATP synthase subunit E family protein [Nocardioides sp.]|uniref:V-type ATP synthase subunit E family protein n=1 Tax=Nocardioides sp. TaxID=35761 RepID=UPI003526F159
MTVVDTLHTQLAPVRRALGEDAERRATELLDEARSRADATVAKAQAESDQVVARARARAVATAQAQREQARAAARREVHRETLTAESAVQREIVAAVVAAAEEMAGDPRYPRLLDGLEARARDQLGPDAVVVRDPGSRPGVVATAGGRRVDYRLAALARRALEAQGDLLARVLEPAP